MANLSQKKRKKMLEFLEKLKEQHTDDDSLIAIGQIEKELTSKKYGLVWEEHEEEVDIKMQTHIPVFIEDESREIVANPNSENYNFLLEGDNLHSLKLLEKTHRGKIDVIYIDPPYNTGSNDFIYGDAIVDKNDNFRHSKWLSFMNKRLKIANKLLSKNGIIFISIDDNEYSNLKILCDSIFGELKYVTTLIWQKKTGASDAKGIATITEYILVYCSNLLFENAFSKNTESYDIKRYKYSDEFVEKRGQYYIDNLDRGGLSYSDSLNYGIECPDGTITFPNGRTEYVNDGWIWKWEKIKFNGHWKINL